MKLWETALIMYTIGIYLSLIAVKNYMIRVLNFVKISNMYYHDEGYFFLKFQYFKEKEMVLMKGSYIIQNFPMILKERSPTFNFKHDMLNTLPKSLRGSWDDNLLAPKVLEPLID